MIPNFPPRQKAGLAIPLLLITSFIPCGAATVTSTTTQHATVTTTGAIADESVARFATYSNSLGYPASYLVMDFELTALSFGTSLIDDISQATLTLTHTGGNYTAGRFDIHYIGNTAPSITTGSTEMIFDWMYTAGFNPSALPSYLSGLTKVATSFYSTGIADIPLDLTNVESSMLAKINAGEKIRFLITESTQTDRVVSAWSGLGNMHSFAPRITMTAVPEPASITLLSGLFLVASFSRKRRKI